MGTPSHHSLDPPPRRRTGGRGAATYVGALGLTLVLSVALVARHSPPLDLLALASLLALGVGAEFLRGPRRQGSATVGIGAFATAAAFPVVGPVGAALVGAIPGLVVQSRSQPLVARIFNAVQWAFMGLIAGLAYLGLGGRIDLGSGTTVNALILQVLLPLLGATVCMLMVNLLLLGSIVRIAEGLPIRTVCGLVLRDLWLAYVTYGIVSFLFVILWEVEGLGPLSILLVLVPMLLAYSSINGRADEREAQQRIVKTLVAAVETRGAQRKGQSERVAEVATVIAETLRLSTRRTEALQFAAAVHNVGLITPPRSRAPGQEFTSERILGHPARSVAMLEGIDFLDESRAAILHHHERWDGGGYPEALRAEQIPLLARVLAVSDLYVSLTWGERKATPQQALSVLEERAGSHLDPACVAALGKALRRGRVSQAHAPDEEELAVDHDSPRIADQLGTSVRI